MFPKAVSLVALAFFLDLATCQNPTLFEDCFNHCAKGNHLLPLICAKSGTCHDLCANDAKNLCSCSKDKSGAYKLPCPSYYTRAGECQKFCSDMDINRHSKCADFKDTPEVDRCTQLCTRDKLDFCQCGKYPQQQYEVTCPAKPVKTLTCTEFCEKHNLFGSLPTQVCEDLKPEERRECYLTCTSGAKGCKCKSSKGKVVLACAPRDKPEDENAKEAKVAGIVVGCLLGAAALIILVTAVVKCSIKGCRNKRLRKEEAKRRHEAQLRAEEEARRKPQIVEDPEAESKLEVA